MVIFVLGKQLGGFWESSSVATELCRSSISEIMVEASMEGAEVRQGARVCVGARMVSALGLGKKTKNSAVKSTGSSSRSLKFRFQHPQSPQPSVTPVPEVLMSSSGLCRHCM